MRKLVPYLRDKLFLSEEEILKLRLAEPEQILTYYRMDTQKALKGRTPYSELQGAWHFVYVIPNHDGEDSDNWDALYFPIGDARTSLNTFVAFLEGRIPAGVEKWNDNLLPPAS